MPRKRKDPRGGYRESNPGGRPKSDNPKSVMMRVTEKEKQELLEKRQEKETKNVWNKKHLLHLLWVIWGIFFEKDWQNQK